MTLVCHAAWPCLHGTVAVCAADRVPRLGVALLDNGNRRCLEVDVCEVRAGPRHRAGDSVALVLYSVEPEDVLGHTLRLED